MSDAIDQLATEIAQKALLRVSCGERALADAAARRFAPAGNRTSRDLAGLIDHTMLKPDATRADIVKLCEEALRYGFATVCVNPVNVALAARLLAGSTTLPIAVVGFPLGATTTAAKVFEMREAIRAGAREIDMVIDIGALKGKEHGEVLRDIQEVVEAARPAPVKVILETGALTRDEKIIGCALAKAAGAAFVKTSTGFGPGGATAEDVALMREVVGNDMGVKASGGIRTAADARRMIEAGATRIGASASVAIVTSARRDGD
jgi:deoxyribose-phosphate aldolase